MRRAPGSRALRRGARALLLATALALTACGSDEERFQEHLARADAHLRGGSADRALLELRSALQFRPADAAVNLRIAELLASRGLFEDARFFYGESQRLDPEGTAALLGEALIAMFEDPGLAEERVARALALDPRSARAHAVRADIALVEGDVDRALAAARAAVALEPRNADWRMQLGIVHQARLRAALAVGATPPDAIYESALRAFDEASARYEGRGHWRPLFQGARVLAVWPARAAEAPEAFSRSAREAALSPRAGERGRALRAILDHARASRDAGLRRRALEELTEAEPGALGAWRELARLEERRGRGAASVYERLLARRPTDARAHLLHARALREAGDGEAALAHLRGVEGRVAEPALLRAGRIDLLRELGRRAEAEAELEALEARHPGALPTRLARAQQALLERRFDAAVALLEEARSAFPESPEPHRLRARAELARGRPEAAIEAADRSLAAAPVPADEILSLKARAQLRAGDPGGALATLRVLARELRPLDARERLLAARAHYALGRDRRARAVIERLVERADAPVAASLIYARREAERDPRRARALLERSLAHHPDEPRLVAALVRLDLAEGRADAALARIDALERAGPELPVPLRLARARALAARGDREAARRETLRALEAQPSGAGGAGALELLAGLGGSAEARAEAVRSLEALHAEGRLGARGLALLGRLHLAAGREERALRRFEQALERDPELPEAQNDLAYLLALRGEDLDRALDLAQRARQSLSEDPHSADTLGFVYLRRGLHGAAAEQFRHALELAEAADAPRPEYLYHLGLALRGLGREAEAAEALRAALALDADFAEAEAARRELEAASRAVREAAS